MRIGIDTSALFLNRSGTATYIRGLLGGFRAASKKTDIIQLYYEPRFDRRRRLLRIYDTINSEIIWTQKKLTKEAVRKNCDIIHGPAMLSPTRSPMPIVLTILDLYIMRHKNSFPLWYRILMNYVLPKIMNSSSRIIAISQFTKQEILDLFPNIPESKITVTLLGVDALFTRRQEEEELQIKKKYSLIKPFIIAVSTIEPRKNIKNLIKSFALIKEKIEHDLVLVGAYGWKSKDLMEMINKMNLKERIKFLGFIRRKELPALYSAADIFVYPSLYEGFGLPLLEAMACGCPVITSNCASMPEVVGTAAIKINPRNIEELSFALETLISDDDKKEALRVEGMKRASGFSWQQCAQKTIEVYEQAKNN
jgi:glycosyltransferase involved in cell wall biosynthesis